LLDSALGKDPGFYEASQLKGDLLALEGKSAEAMEIYHGVLERKPDYLPAYVSLITRQMASGQLDEAEERFGEMRRIAPGNPQTGYVRADLLYRQKRFPEAREAVQQLLRVIPDNVPGLQLADAIEFELRSYFGAERYLQSVLPKASRTGVARRLLIATYLRGGQPDKANIIDTLGTLLAEKGDLERGLELLRQARALPPNNPLIQFNLAVALVKAGNTVKAKPLLVELSMLGDRFPRNGEVAGLLKGMP
jgi:predicted Zn-dependent protease